MRARRSSIPRFGILLLLLLGGAAALSTPAAQAQTPTRTYRGVFAGSGTFSDDFCTYETSYEGTITLSLNVGASNVSGTARHVGQYADVSSPGGPEYCLYAALNSFDETAQVSGTPASLRWSFGHGETGTVAVTAAVRDNAVVGQALVTDSEYTGSAMIALNLAQTGGPTGDPSAPAAPAPVVPAPGGASSPGGHDVPVELPPPGSVGSAVDAGGGTGGATGNAGAATEPLGTLPVNEQICSTRSAEAWGTVAARTDLQANARAQANGCVALLEKPTEPQPPQPTGAQQPQPDPEALRGNVMQGKLQIVRPFGDGVPISLDGSGELQPGDTLVTQSEGASVGIGGGSQLDIGPNAQLTLLDGPGGQVEQKKGRIFYDIKGRRVTVKVPGPRGEWVVVNRGTQFAVDVTEDGAGSIEVTEGAVDVTSAGHTLTVAAGEIATIRSGETPSAARAGSTGLPLLPIAAGALAIVVAAGLVFVLRSRRPT